MTTIRITINDPEQGDVLVTAEANYYDPAIEPAWDDPGQRAFVQYELDDDYDVSDDDDRRICDALIRAIEAGG